MAITYKEETDSWEALDLNDKERNSLIQIAKDLIVSTLGEQLAERIMTKAGFLKGNGSLEEMDTESMGQA